MTNFYKRIAMLKQNIKLVIRNILANKRRNSLTCLGIILGISAVMSMSAVFHADAVCEEIYFEKYGYSNTVIYNISRELRPQGLTQADTNYLSNIDGVTGYESFINSSSTYKVSFDKKICNNVALLGRDYRYFEYDKTSDIICGRSFTKEDEESRAKICILDKTVAIKLFKNYENAVGKKITVGKYKYEVVGVDGTSAGCNDRLIAPGDVFVTIPVSTMATSFGLLPNGIILYSDNDYVVRKQIHDAAISYMEDTLHLGQWDYEDSYYGDEAVDFLEKSKQQSKQQSLIALICLLVGGIGIMNMMFVSVTERTREIGLRKALGATPRKIQSQFIMESVILSLFGGVIGSVLGIVISMIINYAFTFVYPNTLKPMLPGYLFEINYSMMIVGLIFSMIVGVVFGYLPARKASRMNPIDALKL